MKFIKTSSRIATFIRIKEFAEDAKSDSQFNLLNYISQEFLSCDVEQESTTTLINQGKLLILLDGLDEVSTENAEKITIEIRRFTQNFHRNQFVISCRIAVNKLLVDCLKSAAYVTPRVRQEIEETLLLAIADLEKVRNSYINS